MCVQDSSIRFEINRWDWNRQSNGVAENLQKKYKAKVSTGEDGGRAFLFDSPHVLHANNVSRVVLQPKGPSPLLEWLHWLHHWFGYPSLQEVDTFLVVNKGFDEAKILEIAAKLKRVTAKQLVPKGSAGSLRVEVGIVINTNVRQKLLQLRSPNGEVAW